MAKAYFENRDILIPYDKVDRVAIRDSVVEIHTTSYSKPPVLRNADAEKFLTELRAFLDARNGGSSSGPPPVRKPAEKPQASPPPTPSAS